MLWSVGLCMLLNVINLNIQVFYNNNGKTVCKDLYVIVMYEFTFMFLLVDSERGSENYQTTV